MGGADRPAAVRIFIQGGCALSARKRQAGVVV